MTRQLPRWSQLRELMAFRRPPWRSVERRLAKALTIDELRTAARKRVPRAVFDYVDGAAEDEVSLARARAAYAALEFVPNVLRDVSDVDPGTNILGTRSSLPFMLAPTGFTRMMHYQGERAVAAAAARAGIPYTLSTMGTVSIEDIARQQPDARRWFQLYLWRDRAHGTDLVQRAAAAGYEALVLTVDVPVAGARRRDARNGMTIPPQLTLRTLLDGATHPAWWSNFLTTPPLTFASLGRWDGTVAELIDTMFDPTATLADFAWLRETWPGPLVVKGVQSVADARAVVACGADAVVLSNHGGRQLDRAPVPLEQLSGVLDAVGGDAEVYVDTGIRNGADIVAACALGATGCLVGRAYLYGLMAGGERGVARAITLLAQDVRRTMALLGARTIADLRPDHVRFRP